MPVNCVQERSERTLRVRVMFGVVAAPTNDLGASCRKTKLKENDIRFQFWLVFRAYFVAPPSRRLSVGRLPRLGAPRPGVLCAGRLPRVGAGDAPATAGKMPALLSFAKRFM